MLITLCIWDVYFNFWLKHIHINSNLYLLFGYINLKLKNNIQTIKMAVTNTDNMMAILMFIGLVILVPHASHWLVLEFQVCVYADFIKQALIWDIDLGSIV